MSKMHEHWASRVGFVLATAGSAVGLGSLWRFPYVAGETGGGAFVLLYLLFTFFIGLPVFLGELLIGRKTQKSAVLAYTTLAGESSNWKMIGWVNIFTCLLILSYYSVVAGWCLSYTLMSVNQFTTGKSTDEIKKTFEILFASPGINLFWLALYLLINVGIVLGGVRKGIEYWSKILMPALFCILIGMFFYALTMPGFLQAFKFIFKPDFSKLGSSGILSALGMAFFNLSVGYGILVTYGSYMQKEENIPKNGLIIAAMTVFTSLIGALTIFPIVFTFDLPPQGGPGLVFQTLPVLFSQLPASLLISTVFFALLLFAALTSSISLLEMLVANLLELYQISRLKAVFIIAALAFLIGVPSAVSGSSWLFPNWELIYGKNFFDTMDNLAANWLTPFAALFTTIFIGWRMRKMEIFEEFLIGSKSRMIVKPWFFMVRYVAPIVVILIILQNMGLFTK
jgi:NSS family neurotransmitter:Na+ symporter